MFTGKRILTVDDSPTVCIFIKSLLTSRGGQVWDADSGEKGLERYKTEGPFDLILLDLLLPNMNGIEILQRIRANDQHATIVMLTGAGDVRTAITAVQSGADGYIEKEEISIDGDQDEFVHKLQEALQRRQGLVAQAELEQLKADFYAMVTHDLRNPAGIIRMALEIMEDEETGPLNEYQREIVGTLQEGTNRLLHLINNYLDSSQLENGSFSLITEQVDLGKILRSCIRLASLSAQTKDLHVHHTIHEHAYTITGDEERLQRLFDNLIGNAIKYTPRGGQIEIRLDRICGDIVFQVTDSGYGFEPIAGQLLFKKYRRLPGQASRQVSGTGLGLVIAQQIAQAHGGIITAHSDGPNQGATFTVTLPGSPAEKTFDTERQATT